MSRMSVALTVAGHISPTVWVPLVRAGSVVASLRPPRPLRRWQMNAEVVTGHRPTRQDTARAAASWARNLVESLQLERWSPDDVRRTVLISDEHRQRLVEAHRNGGVVIGLPHMGSWDLAGAWACLNGLPVSTAAEEIAEFAYFVAVREALGMKVYGHRDHQSVAKLEADQRDGRVVCLVTDRNFGRKGVPVTWQTGSGPVALKMPAGAAHLSLETGATLFGVASCYEGRRMRLVVSDPITGPDVESRDQQLADFFCDQVRQNVVDWHVLMPFFPGVAA